MLAVELRIWCFDNATGIAEVSLVSIFTGRDSEPNRASGPVLQTTEAQIQQRGYHLAFALSHSRCIFLVLRIALDSEKQRNLATYLQAVHLRNVEVTEAVLPPPLPSLLVIKDMQILLLLSLLLLACWWQVVECTTTEALLYGGISTTKPWVGRVNRSLTT